MFHIVTGFRFAGKAWLRKRRAKESKEEAQRLADRAYFPQSFPGRQYAEESSVTALRAFELRDYSHAISNIDALIKINRTNAAAFAARGECQRLLRNFDAARKDYQWALVYSLTPIYHADIFICLALCDLATDRIGQAIANLERAAQADSLNPFINPILAVIHSKERPGSLKKHATAHAADVWWGSGGSPHYLSRMTAIMDGDIEPLHRLPHINIRGLFALSHPTALTSQPLHRQSS